ncbi:hypothetical protein ASG96_22350 [Terrabacter sp. Soil810]|nr:hypothetical protein ASG96_22350 [Terrabacter sp. Soil810]
MGAVTKRYGQSVAATSSSTPTGRGFSDAAAMHALTALSGPYLPWGSGAMRPAGLVTVCNDIVLNERRRIVELGSGISTVLLARLMTQRPPHGGFLMASVEHDPLWARWVRAQLDREGVGADVTIVQAPLLPHPRAESGMSWYDEAALAQGLGEALGTDPIDLLLVDGPPAHAAGHGLSRYPALPVLESRLTPGATVVLDDVERPGEQEVLRRWEQETGLAFDRSLESGGVAVARMAAEGPGGGHG